MPIYAYRCESCGFGKDVLQKLSDAPLTQCPECGKETFAKQVTAAGFQLKGSGWYVTDFRGGNSGGKAAAPNAEKTDGNRADGSADATARAVTARNPKAPPLIPARSPIPRAHRRMHPSRIPRRPRQARHHRPATRNAYAQRAPTPASDPPDLSDRTQEDDRSPFRAANLPNRASSTGRPSGCVNDDQKDYVEIRVPHRPARAGAARHHLVGAGARDRNHGPDALAAAVVVATRAPVRFPSAGSRRGADARVHFYRRLADAELRRAEARRSGGTSWCAISRWSARCTPA